MVKQEIGADMSEVQIQRNGEWVTVWKSNRHEFATMRLAVEVARGEVARIVDENGNVDMAAQERVNRSLSLAGIA